MYVYVCVCVCVCVYYNNFAKMVHDSEIFIRYLDSFWE